MDRLIHWSIIAAIALTGLALSRQDSVAAPPANQRTAPSAPPASGSGTQGTMSSFKPIEIRGQTRSSPLLNLQSEKSEIKFVRIRRDYREEILKTPY